MSTVIHIDLREEFIVPASHVRLKFAIESFFGHLVPPDLFAIFYARLGRVIHSRRSYSIS